MADKMTILDPITARDFSRGRIAKSAVSPFLVPANSVSNSINVDYSEIIGSGIVRKGKSVLETFVSGVGIGQTFTTSTSDTSAHIYGVNWYGQTFTPSTGQITHSGLTLRLIRTGTPTSLVISIKEASGNLPSGSTLATITVQASLIDTSNPATYYFSLFPNLTLVPSTQYSIVLSVVGGDGANYITWYQNTSGGYSGGQGASSTDSGSTWSALAGQDFNFTFYYNNGTSYNHAPLGNFAPLVAGVAKNVVGYDIYDESSLPIGVRMFYLDGSSYKVSSYIFSGVGNKMRFAVLNGYIFMANGSMMRSSNDGGATWGTTNCITTDSVIPSLLNISKNRMLASGYSAYSSRVYFSSIVDPANSPFIDWNTTPSTGDWIDINPDDGGIITGFSNTSTLTLVFKNNAMYRLNAISKTVDSENIFNVGAPSQEAITQCLGMTYFYSGTGLFQTDGTFPQQISRLGVQDFVNAISNAGQVYAYSDDFNVYFSIGDVTVNFGPEDSRTYTNVVLKFSPRDQNWQVFTYNQHLAQTVQRGLPQSSKLLSAQFNGQLVYLNDPTATGDDGAAIPYSLETQELEFGNRAHTKVISDRVVVYAKNGGVGMIEIKQNDGNFESAKMQIPNRVNVGANSNFMANFFTFRWQGEAKGSRPIFEGYHLPRIQDLGIIQ